MLSPPLASPLEISQQLQRVDVLHQQLKAETVRAQEFLLKLRRGELEAQAQAQAQTQAQAPPGHTSNHHDHDHHPKKASSTPTSNAAEMLDRNGSLKDSNDSTCNCACPHHQPPSPKSEAKARKSNCSHSFSLPLHGHVDEREVRDLEKRVRGLEGRVRGFEGLPPDREMALMEVERLRKELESLARRREGLFEGLSGDLLESAGVRKRSRIASGSIGGKSAAAKVGTNGKAITPGRR